MDEGYIYALDNVTWYNGLAEYVYKWHDIPEEDGGGIVCPDNYCGLTPGADPPTYYQLQIIWIIAVGLFGDWGTSPRHGWINGDRVDEFRQWVLDITTIWRDYTNGPTLC